MMMVSFNYSDKLAAAYRAGAADALLHLKCGGPKPDADKYLEKKQAEPVVARL